MNSFGKLSTGIQNKACRIAMNAGASPVKQAVISAAPVHEGHLQKATVIKIKNYRSSNCWIALIGAGSRYKRLKKTASGRTVKNKKGERIMIQPVKYQHFADDYNHYLQKAFANSYQQSKRITLQRLGQEIEKLMAKG